MLRKMFVKMFVTFLPAVYASIKCQDIYSKTFRERPLPWETTCLERTDIQAESPTFQCDWTGRQRRPVLRDHICMANGVVFYDRFYCIYMYVCICMYLYISEEAPRWKSKYVQKVYIGKQHNPIELKCHVFGNPTPSISWLWNGIPVEESERVCM